MLVDITLREAVALAAMGAAYTYARREGKLPMPGEVDDAVLSLCDKVKAAVELNNKLRRDERDDL